MRCERVAESKEVGVGAPTDLAMNFLPVTAVLDGADSSVLVSADVPTGVSLISSVAYLIHSIEWNVSDLPELDNQVQACLQARSGLAAMPNIHSNGSIDIFFLHHKITTSGASYVAMPQVHNWLPPIVYASPKFVLYAKTQSDEAGMRGESIVGRVGFTTAKLTSAMFREIAQTWGFAG